jgi:putative peptide zinc metalloprotease protein
MPAFYCDVSQAWKLPSRQARVQVALAGPLLQVSLGGAAAISAINSSAAASTVLTTYAICAYIQAVINCLPFVKFDGYVALVGALDRPYLRRDTMNYVIRRLECIIFGGKRGRPVPRWEFAFGLASLIVTSSFIVWGCSYVAALTSGVPQIGHAVPIIIVVVALVCAIRWGALAARRSMVSGASITRVVGGTIAVLGMLAGLCFAVRVPRDETAIWWHDSTGIHVTSTNGHVTDQWIGHPVALDGAGLLASTCGSGQIGHTVTASRVNLGAATPVTISLWTSGESVIVNTSEPSCEQGRAIISYPSVTLARALFDLTITGW